MSACTTTRVSCSAKSTSLRNSIRSAPSLHPSIGRVEQPCVAIGSSGRASCHKRGGSMRMSAVAEDVMQVEALPRWDLEKHFGYSGPMDEAMDKQMADLGDQCKAFKTDFEGQLDSKLLEAVKAYEAIDVTLTSVLTYIMLATDTQLANEDLNKRKAKLMQQYSGYNAEYLTFFSLELADLDEANLEAQYSSSSELLAYRPFLEDVRRSRPFNLPKDVERALSIRASFAGKGPVTEFYAKELSFLTFEWEGEAVNLEVVLAKMSVSTDATYRRNAMKVVNEGLKKFERTAALSLNMVAGSWFIENKERGFQNLRSQRNLSNNVPDEVVDSLLQAVKTTGVEQCKKYYTLKKAILKATQGLETFTWADRNAPIDIGTSSQSYTWEEAVDMVRSGYNKFSPTMANLFMEMVNEKRIDVPAENGKRGGAYCAAAFGCGPFQLLNFTGSQRDVATLAHESGHGCHNMLSYDQGILQFHPPLTLAETASIFGEMIVFRDLLDKAPTREDRLALLLSKIDDIVNSVVRQCSFDQFEQQVHEGRATGQLAPEDFNSMWGNCCVQYYGKEGEVFDSYDNTSHLWTYVSHFHNVPFYVYSYAFADLVVGSLYGVYQNSSDGFEEKLLDLLRAGGTKDFTDALSPFGLNPAEPAFWTDALEAHLGGMLSEAEDLSKELGYL